MSAREELMIAVVVALLIGFKLGEKRHQAQAVVTPDPMAWLYDYSAAE